jgi:hypothetical protein
MLFRIKGKRFISETDKEGDRDNADFKCFCNLVDGIFGTYDNDF